MIPEKNKTYFISYVEEDSGYSEYSGKAKFTGKKFSYPCDDKNHPNFPGEYYHYEFKLIDKSKYPKQEFAIFAEEDIVCKIEKTKE